MEWRTPALEDAFAMAGVVVVEVADLDNSSAAALFADLSETPGMPALSKRVEPQERPALLALMEEADMDDGDFGRIESWAAAMILSREVRSGDPANGVDRAMIRDAAEVIGLESISQQLSMFDELSSDAQNDLLFGVAQSHQSNSGEDMLEAWLTGDEARLSRHVNDSLNLSDELQQVLLAQRNARWVPEIAELVARGRKPFVAVGAGHVIGDGGVVALLQDRGYSAQRIQ